MDYPTTRKKSLCKLCKKKGTLCHIHKSRSNISPKKISRPKSLPSPSKRAGSPHKGKNISDYTEEQLAKKTVGKIILIYGGCFCPLHAGHYNLIDDIISKIRPDIIMFEIMNNSNPEYARHGVPSEHTVKTWNDWGKILGNKYGVDIFISTGDNKINMWRGASPKTKVIRIKVHESKMPAEFEKNPKVLFDASEFSLAFFEKVPRDGKHFYDYNVQRTGNLSATKFTKCLKNLLRDCRKYVPDEVSDKDAYVRDIRQKYGSYLH